MIDRVRTMTMRPLFAGLAALAATLGGGCSWTFDGGAPDLPLLGPKPETFQLPKLNGAPAGRLDMRTGADGHTWGTWTETTLADPNGKVWAGTRRAVNLDDPSKQEVYFADQVSVGSGAIYIYQRQPPTGPDDPGHTQLVLHRPGDNPNNDKVFLFDGAGGYLSAAGRDAVLLWWRADPSTTDIQILRTDGSFQRTIPIPDGVDPSNPPGQLSLIFVQSGNVLFTRGPDDVLNRWTTLPPPTDGTPVPALRMDGTLGKRAAIGAIDDSAKRFLTCSNDAGNPNNLGLRAVYYDASDDKVFDPDPCDAIVAFAGRLMYYRAGGQLRTVPLDGDPTINVVTLPIARIWSFGKDAQVLYSTDPPDEYIEGAGDGWFNGWKFMNRGVDPVISRDATKMHWIENAAKLGGIGDCMWSPVPADGAAAPTPVRLASNCAGYEIQTDGRVLLFDDQAFRGQFNRLVIADEEAAVKYWVAEGAEDYLHIPGSTDLLLLRWSPIGNDVVRVTVPPRMSSGDLGQ